MLIQANFLFISKNARREFLEVEVVGPRKMEEFHKGSSARNLI